MTGNETRDAAKAALADPAMEVRARAAWTTMIDAMEAEERARKPRPTQYEVRQRSEEVRRMFLEGIASGQPIERAKDAALASIGIGL